MPFDFVPYYRPTRDTLHLDYETACELDIRRVGLDRYTAEPSCRVLMAAYRINDGPLQHWEGHRAPFPSDLREALVDPAVERWAFNAQFERVVTRRVLKIPTPIRNWRCTMVLAFMQSFTGGLSEIGKQVGLSPDDRKLKSGDDLIRVFSVPQKPTMNQPHVWRNWDTDPDLWEEFVRYNKQDVLTEEAVKRRLIKYPVPEDEWQFYELDQVINDRGVPLDLQFVANVMQMAKRRKAELDAEMKEITGLSNPLSVAQLLPWVRYHGYPYPNLQKEFVVKALVRHRHEGGVVLAGDCARVLEMRLLVSKTSISKADAADRTVGPGDRVRFMYQFAGASRTGRFAGRNVQPQNMVRTPKMFDPEDGDERLTLATDLIRQGDYDGVELFVNEPMEAFSGAMRSMFRAPEGYQFTVCDYSSVESAGLGWVSKCPRLLDVFRSGKDPYKDFATLFFEKPYDEVTRAERQICKPPTLGCGYRLSAGRVTEGTKTGLLRYAEGMGIEMSEEQAERAVSVFRSGYPEIPQFWYGCEDAIKYVMQTQRPYDFGYIRFDYHKPYLTIRLPSGRYIYYYRPQYRKIPIEIKWEKTSVGWTLVDKPYYVERVVFSYMARIQGTTKWDLVNSHGGVTTENIVQALTRDILKVGLQRLHEAGFKIVGHSHDEAIAVTPIGDNYYTLERMRELMSAPIAWAPGFPLNAAGWSAPFYRK